MLSILTAAITAEDPDESLRTHYKYAFNNGETRLLTPLVKPPDTLYTGQTQAEADETSRTIKYLRVASGRKGIQAKGPASWIEIWHTSVDQNAL